MTDPSPAAQLRDLLLEIQGRAILNGQSMTLAKIVERAGRGSAGYLSDVRNGKRVPSPEMAFGLASAMGATSNEARRVLRLAEQAQAIRAAGPIARRVPNLLKPAPQGFVGRDDDLNVLSSLTGALRRGAPRPSITRVSGLGGIGKTWFVLHWAHRNLGRFPDGQLYADMRGFVDGAAPVTAEEVLPRFLRALGVAAASIPEDPEDQVVLYREATRGRRLLVVLDNVAESAQVEALLPDGPSAVVVTSRNHLRELLTDHTASAMQLDGLTDEEARALLGAETVAARAAAEPRALNELVRMCTGVPMALSIVRAQAVIQAGWPLREVVAYYRDGAAPGDLHRIFWSGYRGFGPELRTAFLMAGLSPRPEVDVAGVASMLRRSAAATGELLATLVGKSLLEHPASGRYRMHDLLRSFAVSRAAEDLTEAERDAARWRLAASLRAGAHVGECRLSPHRPVIALGDPGPGVVAQQPGDDAMEWFEGHYPDLAALQDEAETRGWDAVVWQLAWCLDDYHYRRGLVGAHQRAWRRGLAAAQRTGDPAAIALARLCLGNILTRTEQHEEAGVLLQAALAYFEKAGDVANLAQTHRALQLGPNDAGKLHHAQLALALFREVGDPVWIAIALNALGESLALVGDTEGAREHCRQALELHRELENESGEAAALDSLGIAAAKAGDLVEAEEHYREAEEHYRNLKNFFSVANTLIRLGEVLAAMPGRDQAARKAWTQAVELLEDQGRDDEADEVRGRLDRR
jgi:tetratricopeptide (TPR) repeat protein/transcriptional regulator with XRE-family HTH domain